MTVFDGQLVVGGDFQYFLGSPRRNLVAWDGQEVHLLPWAFSGSDVQVNALTVFDGELVAAGNAPDLGNIARWNGSSWSGFGSGLPTIVSCLTVHDGVLHAAAGDRVWRWNGTNWEPVGQQLNAIVRVLTSFGGSLYAAGFGQLLPPDLGPNLRLVKLEANQWQQVLNGVNGAIYTLLADADRLYIGGVFTYDGSLQQELPGWAVYDGVSIQPMPRLPLGIGVLSIQKLSDGRLLGGGTLSALIVGDTEEVLPFKRLTSAAYFQGQDIIAGGGGYLSYQKNAKYCRIAPGTTVADLDLGDISVPIGPTPFTFFDIGRQWPGFEVPKNSDKHSIRSMAPWLSAMADGVLHEFSPKSHTSHLFSQVSTWAGPHAQVKDGAFYDRYHRVWKLDRASIQYHITNWDQPGYSPIEAILSWPGNGDPTNGEPDRLAPFEDVDNDGIYEPLSGDYPIIKGDQAIYSIMHTEPSTIGRPSMAFDIHAMYHVYDGQSDPALDQSVFVNYRVVNRDDQAYDDVRFGPHVAFQIGCSSNDLAQCDTTRNLFFAYNGSEIEQDSPVCSSAMSYGENPPAQGVLYLNQTLSSHRTHFDDVMSPSFEDMMQGLNFGQPFDHNGMPSNFQYPGGILSDTLHCTTPGRISVGASGPFTLVPGDTLCIDLAFIFSRAASGGAFASIGTLKLRADSVQAYYNGLSSSCSTGPNMTPEPNELPTSMGLVIFPNPANEAVEIVSSIPFGRLSVSDSMGRHVHEQNNSGKRATFHVGHLSPGVYFVQAIGANNSSVVRLLVE